MHKDFDSWNTLKKKIDIIERELYIHEREVWFCALGLNVGDEHDGKGKSFRRPVLILRILSKKTCIVLPLTRSISRHKYRVSIGIIDEKESSVIISQIRVIDVNRLTQKISRVPQDKFDQIKRTIVAMLG